MAINNIAASPVETIPLEPSITGSTPARTAPERVEAAQKTRNQISEENIKTAKAQKEQTDSLSEQEIKQLAEEMNEIMDDLQTRLGFSIREDLNHQVIIEIKDRETNELIKQIPSEELLAIKQKMEEFSGLIFDQNV